MLTIKKPRAQRIVAALCAGAVLVLAAGCGDPGPRALLDGEKMINDRRFSDAVDRLKLAVHLLPDNPQAWNHLGLAHHGARELNEAAAAYRKALDLNENLAAARFNLGALLLELGDTAEAIQELGGFVVLRPTSLEGHVRLGSAQIRADQWEDAAATFSHAFQLSDSNPEILNALGLIHLHRGERAKALPFFDKAIELNSNYAPAKLNRAIYEHRYGTDKSRALAAYQAFVLQHPDTEHSERALIAATALEKELNPQAAIAASSVVSESSSEEPGVPGRLAFAHLTERATSAAASGQGDSDASTKPDHTAESTQSPQQLPSGLAIQPMTDRALTTPKPATSSDTPADSSSANTAIAAAPVQPADTEPLRPATREVEKPTMKPVAPAAPPAARSTDVAEARPEASRDVPEKKVAVSETVTPDEPEASKPTQPVVEPAKPPAAVAAKPETPEEPSPPKTAVIDPSTEPNVAKTDTPTAQPTVDPSVIKPVTESPTAVRAPIAETTVPPVSSPPPTTASRSYVPEYRPKREEEDSGFLQRLNPRRFFRSNDKEEKRTTPLPGDRTATRVATAEPVVSRPPASAPAAPRPVVASPTPSAPSAMQEVRATPKPAPPRYAYLNPSAPGSGDRQAAAPVFLQGLKAHREDRLSDAIKLYQDAARLDGSLYEAHYNLGLATFRANDLSQSLRAYELALAVKPESGSARFNFAQALLKASYSRDAANELERLIASDPTHFSACLAAGNLYARELGETARARAHYLKALQLDPNHRQAQAIRYWLSQNR